MISQQPCLVLMPFGRKNDPSGMLVDFDAVYSELIKPAVSSAGMDAIRLDELTFTGLISAEVFERLINADVVIADLTTANPNVMYELGIRHAARPSSTILLLAEGGHAPFDLSVIHVVQYRLTPSGTPADARSTRQLLQRRLGEKLGGTPHELARVDSPLFLLLDDYQGVQQAKTDVFRDRIAYSQSLKERLAVARRSGGRDALTAIELDLGSLENVESGVIIDLFLSYRAVGAWQQMIDLAAKMPKTLTTTDLVQEQLALALNGAGRDREAESTLLNLLSIHGPSNEAYGILGRVYKDRWARAEKAGDALASMHLDKAIDSYLKGFETDWRDAYPGINAVTLMELREPPDPRQKELLPVVTYSLRRRMDSRPPDYWDAATLLELAVLARDESQAVIALQKALSLVREKWEVETTANNLIIILETRRRRGEDSAWLTSILAALGQTAA